MDRKDKLKMAAASAVLSYIQSEEEQVALLARQQAVAVQAAAPAPVAMNLWGLSGRQDQMHMNSLMLQKAFHGLRFR